MSHVSSLSYLDVAQLMWLKSTINVNDDFGSALVPINTVQSETCIPIAQGLVQKHQHVSSFPVFSSIIAQRYLEQ